MATFRVGQRVRIKVVADNDCAAACRRHLGKEAIVLGFSLFYENRYKLNLIADDGQHVYAFGHALEPIVDDGRKVVSWSECLWQPNKVSA